MKIIYFDIDSLRPDRLAVYHRPGPNIDAPLAARAGILLGPEMFTLSRTVYLAVD